MCNSTFFLCLEPGVVAKSNIILDVKPWDDETGECLKHNVDLMSGIQVVQESILILACTYNWMGHS